MKKFRSFINFDREEAWLNRMAREGNLLTRVGIFYHFEKVDPASPEAAARIRVDYQPEMRAEDFTDYVTLFADSGWRHLAGSRNSGAQYFAAVEPFASLEIFSDEASKAQRYRRALTGRASALLVFAIATFVFIYSGAMGVPPEDWYRTPGLWEMSGLEFVGAFAFESIFVFFRNIAPWLIAALGLILAWQMLQQYRLWMCSRGEATTAA